MTFGNTCGLGFFQLSLKIDYRRLDWCSLPLICSDGILTCSVYMLAVEVAAYILSTSAMHVDSPTPQQLLLHPVSEKKVILSQEMKGCSE